MRGAQFFSHNLFFLPLQQRCRDHEQFGDPRSDHAEAEQIKIDLAIHDQITLYLGISRTIRCRSRLDLPIHSIRQRRLFPS